MMTEYSKIKSIIGIIFIISVMLFRVSAQVLMVEVENDFFAGTDRDYTHGTKVSYKIYSPFSISPEYEYKQFSLFQFIYTPENIGAEEPQINDRPWSGKLGIEYSRTVGNNKYFISSGWQAGVIGPYAFAEEAQRTAHGIVGTVEPLGWDNQISHRFFLSNTGQVGFRYVDKSFFDLSHSFNYLLGTSMGNIGTTIIMRTGWNVPNEFLKSGMEPVTRSFDVDEFNLDIQESILGVESLFVFSGIEFRYVPYNELITDSENEITLNNYVTDYFVGLGLTYKNIDLLYQFTWRGREFEEDEAFHKFGKIALSYRF